jgi:hypothetical protein
VLKTLRAFLWPTGCLLRAQWRAKRILADDHIELSLQLQKVPSVSIKILENRDDPILFFARFLAGQLLPLFP